MKKTLVIEIDCEEDHCKKCEYVSNRFGTMFVCSLLNKELDFDINDRLLRCKTCKSHEAENKKGGETDDR